MNTERYNELYYPESSPYPLKLCQYLHDRYKLKGRLLDAGAGRGDYVKAFRTLKLDAYGLDLTDCDFEKDSFPCPNECYNTVFTKSTIEHVWSTFHVLSEIRRVLKNNGQVICITPDYTKQIKTFYDDPTHVKPFTRLGLIDAFKLAGFKKIKCRRFYQFPIVWYLPFLKPFFILLSYFPIPIRYKLSLHSKRPVLLLSARK